MGRFFQTEGAAPIDYMYKLPAEFMLNALQNEEAQISQAYGSLDLFGNSIASLNYLNPDAEEAKRISEGYNTEIDSITKAMQENPMEYRRLQPQLKNLGNKLQQDFRTGDMSRIQGNFAAYQNYDKMLKELESANKLNPMTAMALRNQAISGYKGYKDPITGAYNNVNTETPYEDINLNKWVDEQLKNLSPDGKITIDESTGMYLVKTEKGAEWKDPEKIFEILSNAAMADNKLIGYLGQNQRLGTMRGVFGDSGELLLRDKDNRFYSNPLSHAMMAGMGEHSFMKTKGSVTQKANPYGLQSEAHQNALEVIAANHRNAVETAEQANTYARDLKILEAELKSENTSSSSSKSKDGTGGKALQPFVGYNSSSGDYTINPLAHKNISATSLAVDINEVQNDMKVLESRMARLDPLSNEYLDLQTKHLDAQKNLANLRSVYGKAHDEGLKGLNQHEREYYLMWTKDGILAQKQKELQGLLNVMKSTRSSPAIEAERVQTIKDLRSQIAHYNKVQQKFDKSRQDFITTQAKEATQRVQGVRLTTTQRKEVLQDIISSNGGFDIYDLSTGQNLSTGNTFFNTENGRGNLLSFSGTSNNIRSYIQANGGNWEDYIEIDDVLPATGLGTGRQLVTFRFKNMPNVDKNKKFSAELPSTTSLKVANTMTKGSGVDAARWKAQVMNGERSNLRYQVLEGLKTVGNSLGDTGAKKIITLNEATRGNRVSLEIEPVNLGEGTPALRVNVISPNGTKQPLGSKTRQGLYYNIEDLEDEIYGGVGK